ncbi:aldo/keto reductase [Sedimentibacter saalensis]|uniref:Aryl-alcohol dehydrogenase-like predicted oxidoreductase n=1 Tax=Sedimentibacter saalensis TaxID=130788 RepID=A0A562J9T3_9FIRM|nr:aldo/keto reductase [Sedimentibacter saalensis]TWH79813.1 aryl-alcohol dehydrogenase-like predicted oxidoreductase [Sedimentibacter saalensis]
MKYINLFDKENVSKLCYGTLSLSDLQNNNTEENKVKLLNYAYDKGINFFDTAELYDNYNIIKQFIKDKDRVKLNIATKSYAYDRKSAEYSVNKALEEMNTDYLDVFMLHEQDNGNNFLGHYQAVERLLEYKQQGIIKHFGISTHRVEAVRDSIMFKEIEFVFPLLNMKGIGISDGTIDDMLQAVKKAKENNKFIMAMKIYGGGHLINQAREAFKFANDLSFVDSIAVGMSTVEEIDANIAYLENNELNINIKNKIRNQKRTLVVEEWCIGCGKCARKCRQNALEIVDGKCVVDMSKCVLCSYCAGECTDFYIKIV